MSRKITLLVVLLFLTHILCLNGFAQPNSLSGLTLELTFLKGKAPAYQLIADSAAEAKWSWYSLFNRVPDFQNSADRPPVKAVKFVPYLEKNQVKINVTVFTGYKFFENEEVVGRYSISENERVTIKELVNFGVEPFEVAVVRFTPSSSALPSVVNKTNSLQLIGVEPNFSTLPSYKIKLLNSSEKAVSGFTFETTINNRIQLSGMPQGEKGEMLIKVGETYEKVIPNLLQYHEFSNQQIPVLKANQTFVITSVIFADGSYEGDTRSAAPFRAFLLGRKLQLKQIIELIQAVEKSNLNSLAEKALKLGTDIDATQYNEFLKDFPTLDENQKNSFRRAAEIASDKIKRDFVIDVELQIKNATSNSTLVWLNSTKEQYQNWMKSLP
jgi:hypothetical protein